MPAWVSTLIVTVALLGGAAILAIMGKKKFAAVQFVPSASIENIKTDIESIKADDLEITKEGNAIVISFAYRKEVPLFTNVGLYIDYAARAGGQ